MTSMSTAKVAKASVMSTLIVATFVILLSSYTATAAPVCEVDPGFASIGNPPRSMRTTPTRSVDALVLRAKLDKVRESNTAPIPARGSLSKEDLEKVMKWISVQVSGDRAPYCYKRTSTRGAGKPLTTCPEGTEKNGALCYPVCDEGFKGNGPVCWQIGCPEGFTDIGAFCQKPAAKGRGFGYLIGDEQKCNNENSQGCEKWGLMWYPKCEANFHPVGANICSPTCPEGMNDTGTGCAKKSKGRGAGTAMGCEEGLEKDGALCYPSCGGNAKGVGPVCWHQCPSHLPENCGAACTADKKACSDKTWEQASAVAKAALGMTGGGAAVDQASSMIDIADRLKTLADQSGGSAHVMLGKPKNFDLSQLTPTLVSTLSPEAQRIHEMIINYGNLFARDFQTLTTPEVTETINSKFSAGAAEQIKKEWGMRHLTLMLQHNGFQAARDLLWIASYGDPSGLTAIAEAFLHPTCDPDTPFPAVQETP